MHNLISRQKINDYEAPPKPVQIKVVFDNVRDGLRVSRRARAAAVDAIVHGVQLVGNAVGNVRTCDTMTGGGN